MPTDSAEEARPTKLALLVMHGFTQTWDTVGAGVLPTTERA
ncbi:MAG: hypothetical protein N3D85_01475 [Candidatus Bathyarchaeota archaeon]|nr:hypothetical protein [Candidatus Bathyarchaeota archaeon]